MSHFVDANCAEARLNRMSWDERTKAPAVGKPRLTHRRGGGACAVRGRGGLASRRFGVALFAFAEAGQVQVVDEVCEGG